jgi:hypothetical protein
MRTDRALKVLLLGGGWWLASVAVLLWAFVPEVNDLEAELAACKAEAAREDLNPWPFGLGCSLKWYSPTADSTGLVLQYICQHPDTVAPE